jgi:ribonuclease Z
MHLQGRTTELHLYAQPELMDIIELQLRLSQTILRYNLVFHPIRNYSGNIIHEDDEVLVRTLVLNHRIPCTGFLFREKPKPRKLLINKMRQYGIPLHHYPKIKAGADFIDNSGNVVPNSDLTIAPGKPRSYAFCSDTMYMDELVDEVREVDLLYHESTFMHNMIERAKATWHSTSIEAATLALKSKVGKLIIGHFSSRYKDLGPMLDEARSIFPKTELAIEGTKFIVSDKQLPADR